MRHLLVLAGLATAHPVAANCMRVELEPRLLTLRETKVPADGGILVGNAYTTDVARMEKTRSEDPSDVMWTARDAKLRPVALTRTSLAPGLSVLRPPASAPGFAIINQAGKQLAAYTHDGEGVAIAAPRPTRLTSKSERNPRWSVTTVTLTLTAAAPPEAVAIIAYREDGKALNFTGLADTHDKDLSIAVTRSGGHCGTTEPAGTGVLRGKVTFAYVDTFGRLSPQSAPIAVAP